jgi:hypothetical protein
MNRAKVIRGDKGTMEEWARKIGVWRHSIML